MPPKLSLALKRERAFFPSFKIPPAVRVIARQLRDKTCLAAIFVSRHQGVSSGPLGKLETEPPQRSSLGPSDTKLAMELRVSFGGLPAPEIAISFCVFGAQITFSVASSMEAKPIRRGLQTCPKGNVFAQVLLGLVLFKYG